MNHKTISLDDDAYELLEARMREDESFSDTVKRLTAERSWKEVAGIWAGETEELNSKFKQGREDARERRERGLSELNTDEESR